LKKQKDEGIDIDFANLDAEQKTQMTSAVKTIAEYIVEKKRTQESIKETLDNLISDLKANKPSAKTAKKLVNKAAKVYANHESDLVKAENEIFELFIDLVEGKR
jgi:hypothetical protein